MKEMKNETTGHTPGPWEVIMSPQKGEVNVATLEDEDKGLYKVLARCYNGYDARLIAAAPTMETFIDLLWQLLNQFPDGRCVNWESMRQEAETILENTRGEK